MTRKLLFTGAAIVLGSTLMAPKAEAAPIACTTGMTIQTFITNPDGCFIGDKVVDITGFTSNLLSTQVNVNVSNPGGGAFYNVQFDAGANLAFTSLNLAWDVNVFMGTDVITIVDDQMFAVGNAPSNDSVNFCAEGACKLATNTLGLTTVQFTGLATQSLQNTATYIPGVGATGLQSIEQTIQQTSVPEPSSLMLLGTALFGLASASRRRLRKQ